MPLWLTPRRQPCRRHDTNLGEACGSARSPAGISNARTLFVSRSRNPSATLPLPESSSLRDCRLGAYALISLLARGGMAGVYLAEHIPTGTRVALKLLDPFYADRTDIVDRFLFEQVVARGARHPGLVEITHASLSSSGVPYLVMEYLDGENLESLAERGEMALDAIASIGMQIASAVAALHRNGFIHCDIKPTNVFLLYPEGSEWPQVKVVDYGVATAISAPAVIDGSIAGTPAYMPPEQWRGAPCPASDVYALGCLLHELLTGEQPFHGTLPQLMVKHSDQLAPRPSAARSEIPADFERLVLRMLAKDQGMRPTMDEVATVLSRFRRSPVAERHAATAAFG